MSYFNTKMSFVELIIGPNSTQQRFQFGQEQFLRQKQIVSIDCFNSADIPNSPQGNAVVSPVILQNSYVTFYGADPETDPANPSFGEWLWRVPLVSLHRVSGAEPFMFDQFRLVPQQIIWEKSYIDVMVSVTSDTPASFIFSVGYIGTKGDSI